MSLRARFARLSVRDSRSSGMQHACDDTGKAVALRCESDGSLRVVLARSEPQAPPVVEIPPELHCILRPDPDGGAKLLAAHVGNGDLTQLVGKRCQLHTLELQSLVPRAAVIKVYDCLSSRRSRSLRRRRGADAAEAEFQEQLDACSGDAESSIVSYVLPPHGFRQLSWPAGIHFSHGVALCTDAKNDDESQGAVYASCSASVP